VSYNEMIVSTHQPIQRISHWKFRPAPHEPSRPRSIPWSHFTRTL